MSASCEIPRWQLLKQQLINLHPREFKEQFQADSKALLIDVRTVSEFEKGSLPNAIHIDYFAHSFYEQLERLDRSKHYYIICRTGRRSVRTGVLMKNWGFKNVVNLEGGLTAWKEVFGNVRT